MNFKYNQTVMFEYNSQKSLWIITFLTKKNLQPICMALLILS